MGGARGKIILVEPKEHGDTAKKRKARVARLRTLTESSMTGHRFPTTLCFRQPLLCLLRFPPPIPIPIPIPISIPPASALQTVNSTIRYSPNAMPRFFFFFFNHTRLQMTLGVSVNLLANCPEQAIPVRLHIDDVEPLQIHGQSE